MSLRSELADPARLGDTDWLLTRLKDVVNKYAEFENRTDAAETLSLWGQRFVKSIPLRNHAEGAVALSNDNVKDLDRVLFLMVDRWTSGDPSYLLALRKAMQHLLYIREQESRGADAHNKSVVPNLVKHAADFARDDPRIAFGSLESMAKSSPETCAMVRDSLSPRFISDSFKILTNDPSRSGIVGKCLVTILTSHAPPTSWFDYVKPYINDVDYYQAIMTYFVQPMLKQSRDSEEVFGQFYELCKPQSSLSVEIGILKAAKNAKLDVTRQIQSSATIKQGLSSLHCALRFDALSLLCGATRKLTHPVPLDVFDAIIENAPSLLAESAPKYRADVYSAFKNLLIRVNTSKSRDDASRFVNFIADWCSQSLVPGMPYRCLATASRLLELFVEYGFSESVLTPGVVRGLVNCVVSDFADIRESCVLLLRNVSDLPQVDANFDALVQESYALIKGSRTGDAGARLLEFLNDRRPEANLGDRVAGELETFVEMAERDVNEVSRGQSIYGSIIALRVVPPKHYNLIPLVLRIWHTCSPPLMTTAPEGSADEITNYCWKAIKESCLLVESLASKYSHDGAEFGEKGSIVQLPTEELLDESAHMLTDITHWGAFSAIPPAFIAVARLDPEKALSLVWKQIRELEARTKTRSVTRRSAGLPLLITSALTVKFDDKVVESLFHLATLPFIEGELEELEMPQVHGMNCLRAVITDSDISKPSTRYIERALELSLEMFRSSVWSLRNCAAMMFSSLFKRLFGVQGLPVPGSVFFQKFKRLQPLLSNQLSSTSRNSDLQSVYPALAILAKLQTVSKNDQTLDVFWNPVIELLGSPSWKIREIAASAVVSMTHVDLVDDVVKELAHSLNPGDQNQLHGFALAMNRLLDAQEPALKLNQLSLDSSKSTHPTSSLAIIEKIIRHNKCFESSTELFKAWRKLGGQKRIIAFDDLPSPRYLNPSIATFESEQTKISSSNVEQYAKHWSPVLRNLPGNEWTFQLARDVLSDETQLPDLQAQCIRSLMHSPLISEFAELGPSLLNPKRPACVRQEALVFVGKFETLKEDTELFNAWLSELVGFSRDESPVESRRSAAHGIGAYLSSGHNQIEPKADDHRRAYNTLFYTLFRLLSDEEDDIREHCARTSSAFLGFSQPQCPSACEPLLLSKLDPAFITRILEENLFEDCEKARSNFEHPNDMIFVVEKESLHRDEQRNITLMGRFCSKSVSSTETTEAAAQVLNGLDFDSPLKASADCALMEVKARIAAIRC